jgi:nucleoside-diphosphate-sugar epimerase
LKNLVTGATGLVGMHIALDLLRTGEYVQATFTKNSNFDNVKKVFSFYKSDHLYEKINWIEMNLEDTTDVFEAVKGINHVYHSAAIVSFNKKDKAKISSINIKGTANIVNACLEENIKKLGFISSVASIGRKANKQGLYTEKTKWSMSKANSYYAISKYKAENEVWRGIQEGLKAVITNPGIILGPSSWNRSSTTIFKQIHKGLAFYPNGSNGFVDVRDVSRSIIELVKSPINAERYILVGDNLSYKKMFDTVAKALNTKAPFKMATKPLLEIAWRLEALRCFLARKNPSITKETARTSVQHNNYANEKIKTALNFEFNTIDSAIKNTAKFLLKFN